MIRKIKNPQDMYMAMQDAIHYIRDNADKHPSILDMAKQAGMSQSRFEHVFSQWAGISPKRFLAHLTKLRAKVLLNSENVLKAAHASGLSGPGRLHGLMVTHEAVTPGEFKSGSIEIAYGIHNSPFGWCVIGVTKRGICHLAFTDSDKKQLAEKQIRQSWPKARLIFNNFVTAPYIKKIFYPKHNRSRKPLHLLLKGTNFQIKVWEALLNIPNGQISSYSAIARAAGFNKAVRAVGSACGKNSIAYLIPCHRVLTSDGKIGGYRWGIKRKETILAWEAAHNG
jgi:AraC family transcriptional regulator, regulatory protein of adaptative response / methylated-DNA-[protein]-cysteine methyltransferase